MASGQDVWQDEGEPFMRITPKAANEMLADDNVQLIDVRNQDEWDAGHVPRATLIPVDDLFFQDGRVGRRQETSLHLRHGSTQRPGLRDGRRF